MDKILQLMIFLDFIKKVWINGIGENQMNIDVYNNVACGDASQLGQVIMLYDGAINFIQQAKEAMIRKDSDSKYKYLSKAIAIITGLNSCLDTTGKGDETKRVLEDFYMQVDMHLAYIKCNDRLESCDRVIADLKRMRDAWINAEKQVHLFHEKHGEEVSYVPYIIARKDSSESASVPGEVENTELFIPA